MKALSTLLTILTFLSHPAFGITIKGRVTDQNGEGLPFATVLEKGTTNGTSTNGEGYYELEIASGNRVLSAQYVGYKTESKNLQIAQNITVNFQLSPQQLEVKEVVIKADGEDPAYPIMRKVIAKRKYHADLLKSLQTEVYLKGALRMREIPTSILGKKLTKEEQQELKEGAGLDSAGKGVLYLLEQITQYAYQAPDKEYNKVMSVRQSGDPKGLGFATMPPITNIYDNNVIILSGLNERGFITPANSNAFLYYKYKFLGSYMDGDRMINKIQVIPKRKFEPLFSGYVYVVDDEWVFQSVDLVLGKESQLNVVDTMRLEQTYMPVAKDVWIIQSQVLYPVISLLGFKAAGSFLTSYRKQKVNEPIPDEVFSGKIIASYDSAALDHKTAYWDSIRPVPLEADEEKDFHVKDSMHTERSKYVEGFDSHNSLDFVSFMVSGAKIRSGKNIFSMRPLLQSVSYNTVEGVVGILGLSWYHKFSDYKKLNVDWTNRYGFANYRFQSLVKMNYTIESETWRKRNWQFNVEGGQYVYQLNNDNPIPPFLNMAYTLFGAKNYMKLYEAALLRVKVRRHWGNGLKASLSASYEHREPLTNSADYTFAARHDDRITANQPSNLPPFETHNAAVIEGSISYQPGWRYIQYPKHRQPLESSAPIFSAHYAKGIPGIGDSKTDFDKWSLGVEHSLKLRLLGSLQYRFLAGGFFNTGYVGIPDMKHLFGNRTFIANPYLNSFQLADYYRFSNTATLYGQGHVEWHMGGWLTNKVPLFRRLNWFLVGGSNVLYIDRDDYYAEVFVGLENIGVKMLRFGRVDFIAGYESGKNKPSFGVRIGLGEALWNLLGISNGRD